MKNKKILLRHSSDGLLYLCTIQQCISTVTTLKIAQIGLRGQIQNGPCPGYKSLLKNSYKFSSEFIW